jgi:hypothetical protein
MMADVPLQIRVNRTSGACVSFLPLAMREADSHGQVAEFSAYYLKTGSFNWIF